jgi:hypothetical protein
MRIKMKTYKNKFLSVVFILSFGLYGNIFAQTTGSSNQPDELKFSFTERMRIETWDNSVTLSRAAKAGNSYLRSRTSVMGQWTPSQTFEFDVKLTNEFRTYFAPSTNTFHLSELFFDQLYIKWNTKEFLDGVLTFGRQNINLGEGFVIMDGSPLDGSRSIYFNALRYDLNIDKENSLTFFGLLNPKTDGLPVLNGNDIDPAFQGEGTWTLTEQKEIGAGVYYTGKLSWANLQSYYIRKDYTDPAASLGQVKSDVNTLGTRMNISLDKNFALTFEGAYQFGSYGNFNRNSYGGYAYFDYNTLSGKIFLPKVFTVGTIYLSGDDPATNDIEGWDPIFSRWPKWSESYIYTQIKEFNGKPAYWSNLISFYATIKFKFDEQMNFIFDYHHMMAPQAGTASSFLGTGKVRGDLFICKLLFDISKNLTGHIIFEHFIPGDYYFSGADVSNWARFEFLYKI